MNLLGREAEVTEVDVVEKKGERAAEYTLEDGAVIRVTTVPTSVVRIDGQYNSDGSQIVEEPNARQATD